jgi:hypothetical protein
MIPLNALMMASIPIEGSHYLVDMLSGGAVALAAHGFARWLTARHAAPFVRVDEPRQATPAPVPFR